MAIGPVGRNMYNWLDEKCGLIGTVANYRSMSFLKGAVVTWL